MLSEPFEVQVVVQVEHGMMPVPRGYRPRDGLQPVAHHICDKGQGPIQSNVIALEVRIPVSLK